MTGNKIIDGILGDLMALPKKFLKKYKKNGKWNYTKIAIDLIPFLVIAYMFDKYFQAVCASDKADILDKCVEGFSLIFQVEPNYAPYMKGCEWHNKNTHFWRRKFPTLLCLNEYIFYTESVTNNSPP